MIVKKCQRTNYNGKIDKDAVKIRRLERSFDTHQRQEQKETLERLRCKMTSNIMDRFVLNSRGESLKMTNRTPNALN